MKIDKKIINLKNPPFIIAELSANHNGSLKNALKLVDHAAESGVSAIKIQTINPYKITLKTKKKILLSIIKKVFGIKNRFLTYTRNLQCQFLGKKKY